MQVASGGGLFDGCRLDLIFPYVVYVHAMIHDRDFNFVPANSFFFLLVCSSKPQRAPHVQAWDNLRPECAEQLRQPLCLALLRNCTSPYDEVALLSFLKFPSFRALCGVRRCRGSTWQHSDQPLLRGGTAGTSREGQRWKITKRLLFDVLID